MNDDKYIEKGFFSRLFEMFKGLGKPHDTREYKLARIELQRLAAPLVAIVVPTLFCIVLCVVTAISSQPICLLPADIPTIDEPEPPPVDPPEPPPVDIPSPEPNVEITVDMPTPEPFTPLPPAHKHF